jgi:iron(III) transport system permease protein
MRVETMQRHKWKEFLTAEKLIFIIPSAIVVYLVLPPLLLLVISTFRSTSDRLPLEPGPWTLANYLHAFNDPETYLLLQTSLLYALGSVLTALTIAVVLVWLIERTDLPRGNVVLALVLAPLAIPGMVKAIGWSFLANPNIGVLNLLLRQLPGFGSGWGPINIYSLPGIIFVSALSHVPSMILMIAGAFRNFDPTLEEAGQVSGASPAQTQRLITLPLLRPALLASFMYYFAYGLEDFQIPAILGLNAGIHVFSTRIYLATHPARGLPDFGLAGTYSMLLFLVAMILISFYRKTVKQSEKFAVVTGKGYRPRRSSLGAGKYAALGGIALYLLLAAVLPMLTILWVSLQPYFSVPSLKALTRITTVHYSALVDTSSLFWQAVLNTIILSPLVSTATMLLSTLIAWISVRGTFRGKSFPDLLTFINIAVPTVVFGLAIMFVYLSFPPLRPVYGTLWILVIALTTRYLTYSTRLMGGAVVQVHRELEEAAEMSGASKWQTFLRVTLPLLFPSFLNGWLWVAVHSLREATIAVMLMTSSNVVIASLIWSSWQAGVGYGSVAAMSVIVVGATTLLTFVSRITFIPETRH